METPDRILGQRIVGGNLALDLLNSQNGPAGGGPEDDVLLDYADVVAWGQYTGVLTPSEADRLVRIARRRPDDARAVFERTRSTRDSLYELFSAVARGAAPRSARSPGSSGTRPTRWPTAVLSRRAAGFAWTWTDDRRPRAAAVAGHPCRAHAADRWATRPREGMRVLPVPVPRREQEPEPALVLDGRLRRRGQDAHVCRPARVRPQRPGRLRQKENPGWSGPGFRKRRVGCGDWIRTSDLRVMSPTSCRCSTPLADGSPRA